MKSEVTKKMSLESEQIPKDLMLIEKQKSGLRRNLTQIDKTIRFELRKGFRTFLFICFVFVGIFTIYFIIQELLLFQEVALPDDPIVFISQYLDMFGFIVILSAAGFAGSIIAEDFHKQTGNLLFPKISKRNLLIGRIISRYALNALCVIIYYILVGIVTFIKYEEIPLVFWGSMGWALLYTFMIFTFVTFLSSLMKSTSITIIVSVLFMLILFNMITMIFVFAGLKIEPLFIITYYEGIISASMAMPDPRYAEIMMPMGQGQNGMGGMASFFSWSTPSEAAALIGMLILISIFLGSAYFLYRRRQSKSE